MSQLTLYKGASRVTIRLQLSFFRPQRGCGVQAKAAAQRSRFRNPQSRGLQPRLGDPTCPQWHRQPGKKVCRLWKAPAYFSLASVSLIALKFGNSFGDGVCSLYCTTPCLSMTIAARALTDPSPRRSASSVP